MENEKSMKASPEEINKIENEIKAQWVVKAERMAQQEQEQANLSYQQASISQFQRYEPSPREYLHNFLLQAKNVGCNVDNYILDEIKKMYIELER